MSVRQGLSRCFTCCAVLRRFQHGSTPAGCGGWAPPAPQVRPPQACHALLRPPVPPACRYWLRTYWAGGFQTAFSDIPLYVPKEGAGTTEVVREGDTFARNITHPLQGVRPSCLSSSARCPSLLDWPPRAQAPLVPADALTCLQRPAPSALQQTRRNCATIASCCNCRSIDAGTFKLAIVTRNINPGESVGALSGEVLLGERWLGLWIGCRTAACAAPLLAAACFLASLLLATAP